MAKILLVEDDNNLREIYEARLQAEGYDIVSAQDGEEALVVAKAEKPDLVISDVMMPKISGFEMLDILRNTEGLQHVKVIMLTALGQSEDQERADKLGADRYLVKSQVTLEDIVKTAHDLLADEAAPTVPGASSEPTTVAASPAPAAATPAAETATPPAAPAQTAPATAPPLPPEPSTTVAASPAPAAATPAADTPTQPQPATPTSDDSDKSAATPEPDSTAPPTPSTTTGDKLMNDAVNALIADTEAQGTDTKKTPAEEPNADEKTSPSDNSEATNDAPDQANEDESSSHVHIANKKIIKPLDDGEPKKDINELLALEEAKERGETAPAPAVSSTEETPSEPPSLPKNDGAASTAQEEAAVEAKIEDFVSGATTEPDQPMQITTPAATTDSTEPTASSPPPPEASPETPPAAAAPKPATTIPITEPAPSAPPAPSPAPQPTEAAPSEPKNPPDPNTIAI